MQGNQNGDDGSRRSIQTEDGYTTRYSIHNLPEKLPKLLYELAKATRGPSYRKHGAFPDSKELRSVITSVTDATKGDADDIARFLRKLGFLNANLAFDAETADKLIEQMLVIHPDMRRPHRTFVELVDGRVTDPGPPPPPAPEEPKAIETQPFAHLAELEDPLLQLHEQEVQRQRDEAELKLAESKQELAAIRKEKARRITALQQELEAEEKRIKTQKDELAKQLADLMAR